MPLTTFVDKTVNGLKSLLDHNGTIKLFGSGGDITESQVIFPDYGASEDEIQILNPNTAYLSLWITKNF